MFPPEIFEHLQLQPYLSAWVARHPEPSRDRLFRWMAQQIGVSRQQVWNLVTGEHKVQPEQVADLARVLGLDPERREYLRRLVAVQHATEADGKTLRLSVWEMHAAKNGIPATSLSVLLTRLTLPGSEEAVIHTLRPLLETWAPDAQTPQQVAPLLIGGPDPDVVARAWADPAPLRHEVLSPRMVALGWPHLLSREAAAWHGLLELSREALLRVPAADRDYQLYIGSLDEAGTRATEAADLKLARRLRAIVRRTAEHPVTRIYLLLTESVPLTELIALPDEGKCPPVQTDLRRLPPPKSTAKSGEEGSTPALPTDGRPCLLHYLDLPSYARAWIAWRKGRGRPASVRWLAPQLGVSRTVAHELITGATLFSPHHVAGVVRALGLSAAEATYAQGVARFAVATDKEDRWRERHALVAFAAQHGVRTREGDLYQVASHWGPQAVAMLTCLPDFQENPAWISLMLRGRVPLAEAEDWLETLERVGAIVRDPMGRLVLAASERQVNVGVHELAPYSLHDSILRQLQAEVCFPVAARRWRGWALALCDAAVPEVREALRQWQEEILQVFLSADLRRPTSPSDRVVACAAQLFPCTAPFSLRPARRRRG